MAKKSAIRVALDLETTGLHSDQDAILEIAAIKFQGTEVIDTFETFVAPGRPIPYRVQRLTGIKAENLVGAPPFSAIAKKLHYFLGDYPIVGHSIPFDVGFLRQRGIARTNPLVDTFEMATVLLPSLSSYNLGQVAESLGVRVPQDRHRAMVDTVLAMEVFLALYQRLWTVDLDLLNDLAHLDAPRSWPLLHFFRSVLRERQEEEGVFGKISRGSLGDRFAAQLGMDPRVLSFAIAQGNSSQEAVAPTSPAPAALLVRDELAPTLPALTAGEQQAYTAVHDALSQKSSLLLEVSLGGHNYMPALLPALKWVAEGDEQGNDEPRRLLIACANQQHAKQLVEKVLPQVQAQASTKLSVAYQAERGGYLCTHRWFGAAMRRTSGELSAEQARGLAKLRLWAHQTLHGERSELTMLQQEISAWDRISSGVERTPSADERSGSSYARCTYRRNGYCFVQLAEQRVNAARIVVTTHTALFDDLSQKHSLLAGIQRRLILDADLLDEENFRWGSEELNQFRLFQLLNTLGSELSDGRYQGLLALASPSLRENGPGGLSTKPTVAKSELDSRLLHWFQSIKQARASVERLFACFTALVDEQSQQGHNNGGGREKDRGDAPSRTYNTRHHERSDQPLRLNAQVRHLSAWDETERCWQQTMQRLQAVIDLAQVAEKTILVGQRSRSRLEAGSGEASSVAFELLNVAQALIKQKQLGQQALSFTESDVVYWLRMPPTTPAGQQHGAQRNHTEHGQVPQPSELAPILHAQFAQIATLLNRFHLTDTEGTIFVGSALTVEGSFAFIRQRLGLESESCQELALGAVHHEQTLLYLPNDVPAPNVPQYQRHLDETLIRLATALDGQVVALFTSHAALRSTYSAIKSSLESRGILVLGQGVDGSPRQLWQVFQTQERVVILGTGSFWDGMDENIKSPVCLFIARLPMPVLNDPPIAARVEQYSDQLHQLTVPMAALRTKRVLNRLTWRDERRNIVVLFDRRVTAKEYGAIVLHSLPRTSRREGAVSLMPETILDWLTDTGSWDDTLS
ncbi:MAG TPA: exonuclease domain-containing protein [Dictyobacter sp.]|jgi:DNA polymerase III epsilon subunit family exonuclease|nr:exonuclease domain-containing protein [Dictyobacter sp.]